MNNFELSELGNRIASDRNAARLSNSKIEVALLSTLLGDIQNKQISTDDGVIALIKKYIENNEFTISKSNPLSVENLYIENHVLSQYVPQQMTEEEIAFVLETKNLKTVKDMMNFLKTEFAGRYNGKLASSVAASIAAKS